MHAILKSYSNIWKNPLCLQNVEIWSEMGWIHLKTRLFFFFFLKCSWEEVGFWREKFISKMIFPGWANLFFVFAVKHKK